MEYFLQYKIVILRSLGALMLVIGFAVHFWVVPQKGLSANDKAAARVARMEASAKGESSSTSHASKKDDTKFLKAMQETKAKQVKLITLLAMAFGVGFLGYSFIPRKDEKV